MSAFVFSFHVERAFAVTCSANKALSTSFPNPQRFCLVVSCLLYLEKQKIPSDGALGGFIGRFACNFGEDGLVLAGECIAVSSRGGAWFLRVFAGLDLIIFRVLCFYYFFLDFGVDQGFRVEAEGCGVWRSR